MPGLAWFSRSTDDSPSPLSLIGADTTISGDVIISGAEDLRIEGTIRADVERAGRVLVAPTGTVHGTVQARSIQVAGTVHGALRAERGLLLTAGSTVRGRLQAGNLTIEPGADFRGEVYNEEVAPATAAPVGNQLPSPAAPDEASGPGAPLQPERAD
ncbi:MAG: polymer-forming cytoskeletal protein [Salinivenus sp.]